MHRLFLPPSLRESALKELSKFEKKGVCQMKNLYLQCSSSLKKRKTPLLIVTGEQYDPDIVCSVSPLQNKQVPGIYVRFMASSSSKVSNGSCYSLVSNS